MSRPGPFLFALCVTAAAACSSAESGPSADTTGDVDSGFTLPDTTGTDALLPDGGGDDTGAADVGHADVTPSDTASSDAAVGPDGVDPDKDAADKDSGPTNTAPKLDALPPVTLAVGHSTTLDITASLHDGEDPVGALAVTAQADHVAVSDAPAPTDPDSHVLTIMAPTDWTGEATVYLTVTDTGGLKATGALAVTVTDGVVIPPVDCHDVEFSYTAAASVAGVQVVGSWDSWTAKTPLLDPDGDHVFTLAMTLDAGAFQYKLVVDGAWIADPGNPKATPDGYGAYNSVLEVCAEPPSPLGCGEVLFRHNAPSATAVSVAGSFNGWNATADPLADADGDGTWELVKALAPGSHQYKLVVDGAWMADPTNPKTVSDGFGGNNSVLDIAECGAAKLVSATQSPVTGPFVATFAATDGTDLLPTAVTVSVDGVSGGASVAAAAGGTVTVTAPGLATGIHDVRVTIGAKKWLLKVYIGVSTDWRDATLYFAMTDRFANGDPSNDAPIADVDLRTNYQGGDFKGIISKLESHYFKDLGVGALWISWPIDNFNGYADGGFPDQDGCGLDPKTSKSSPMRFTAYHGYWPANLYQTEEHFGTLDDLRKIATTAHAQGIRLLLDFTANHVHEASPLYAEGKDKGWFNVPAEICQDIGWDTKPKTCWFTSYLPDLNYTNGDATAAVLDLATWWVKESGADGFRFDAVKHLEMSFVTALRTRLSAEFETTGVPFYVVGETFDGDAGLIKSFVGPDKLNGQFDFPTNLRLLKGFATQEMGLDSMDGELRSIKATYGAGALMSTFLGNHDMARFISHASGAVGCGIWDITSEIAIGWRNPPAPPTDEGPYQRLRLAFVYLFTTPGLPLIYYGDEFGLPGAGDPDNRRMMRFDSALSALEAATLADMKTLGQARAAHASLRTGAWPAALWTESDLLAYARTASDDHAVVVLNRSGNSRSIDLGVSAVGLADGTAMAVVYGPCAAATVVGGKLAVTVAARTACIFTAP